VYGGKQFFLALRVEAIWGALDGSWRYS